MTDIIDIPEDWRTMKPHPLATLFPMMGDADYALLRDDIAANGLREPIVVYDWHILDGNNRHKACVELGIKPDAMLLPSGQDPLTWIVSKNLHRRHLTDSQRALIAAEIADTMGAALPAPADAIGVGLRLAQYAGQVLHEAAPPVIKMVRDGDISVFTAHKLRTLPKQEQTALAAAGSDSCLEAAKAIVGEIPPRRPARTEPPAAAAKSSAAADSVPVLYTSLGKPFKHCDRAELEAELARQEATSRMLKSLIARMPPVGPVEKYLSRDEFAGMWAAGRGEGGK